MQAAGTAAANPAEGLRFGRIPVTNVQPVLEDGRFPAKAVRGADVQVRAVVFREGHDAVGVTAVLFDPSGAEVQRARMAPAGKGTDAWSGVLTPTSEGAWSFAVEGWTDLYATWTHNAAVKINAGVDVEVMLAEGAALLGGAAKTVSDDAAAKTFKHAAKVLADAGSNVNDRLAAGTSAAVRAAVARFPLRDLVTASRSYPLAVERDAAGRGAWYEFFPRSEGAKQNPDTGAWTSGTFTTAALRLPAVAAMGFYVVYLPPIHPIGTINRKGPNNTLTAGPGDPGSPWAIGSSAGGHDAIHPDLGTFADFDAFVAAANELELEVALDLALQCAPDHPWATDHPEWFTTRIDGTIAYAENPPKKYQDIYPLNFDNDPAGLSAEILRIVRLWIEHGVRIFRVDNPHTKPVWFWEWLIGTVNAERPDIVFLAEAFTRPAMMAALGRAGFQQSYSYFTWRNTKEELEEYLLHVSRESAGYFRPNFFVNTPDILTEFLQYGGPAAYKIRAILAATGSPLWGMYAGYELYEHVARPGSEENLDNEKYEYKDRDFAGAEAAGKSLAPFVTLLNGIRRAHPALLDLENLTLHTSSDDATLVFSKHKRIAASADAPARKDTIIVVINVDPHSMREGQVTLDLDALELDGLSADGTFEVEDLVTGATWNWGKQNYFRLDAHLEPAHILHVRR
ncbi:alpha-1,4-glucan:maltose-1-phosphate maltosyltransferase (plasmid) [Arthrobacter sp. ERGS1:01]|uniref:alpha-1,4-glucan--maltose-1-phosphate maltosyltransferase n=1 Tax=Arthrobacter sp. ERGS1:01 TaxID=1704044 RepID=UPI0006B52807|nr:alpha-1,4-glucan--maltose-1-phosphate maltosyltransferase [Arthrobacter sp. ERGS1:01]ALE04727.1 alpha-1,4-glucan:maltose-1-phosphate maltosyltransferase [Arthrobacter sp. ERGS1:01]